MKVKYLDMDGGEEIYVTETDNVTDLMAISNIAYLITSEIKKRGNETGVVSVFQYHYAKVRRGNFTLPLNLPYAV
jgi:hypothetical protein